MIDIVTYRARIGTFSMPCKRRSAVKCLYVSARTVSVILRIVLAMAVLLVASGDVEQNPGPPRPNRQRQLSFAQAAASPSASPTATTETRQRTQQQKQKATDDNVEVMSFLRDMKSDIKADFDSINRKIDVINSNISDLKSENEELRRDNQELRIDLETMRLKFDSMEAQSRRNNLRFKGINGPAKEDWGVTEGKIRNFIKNDLGLHELENVDIERAHRVSSGGRDNCPIIVKFLKFKDKEAVLSKARRTLNKESPQSVHEDYTPRVLHHRRELGKRLVEARSEGSYASISYDKLIIENELYRYDDKLEKPVLIGQARGRPADKFHARHNNQSRDQATDNSQRRGSGRQLVDPVNSQDDSTQ